MEEGTKGIKEGTKEQRKQRNKGSKEQVKQGRWGKEQRTSRKEQRKEGEGRKSSQKMTFTCSKVWSRLLMRQSSTGNIRRLSVQNETSYKFAIFSLTLLVALTVYIVYVAVFGYQNHGIFNMTVFLTVDLVVILTLALGIQTKMLFLEY